MLTKPPRVRTPVRQTGIVLFIALIVLVVMTLAAIALVRSVDTTNLIAGNLTFQQSATQSGDEGIETAIAWLLESRTTSPATLEQSSIGTGGNGYVANGNVSANNPSAGQSWDAFWAQTLINRPPVVLPQNAANNTVSYVIDRLCDTGGDPKLVGSNCSKSTNIANSSGDGSDQEAGFKPIEGDSAVYYRVTARIAGPKNTVSYVQAIFAM